MNENKIVVIWNEKCWNNAIRKPIMPLAGYDNLCLLFTQMFQDKMYRHNYSEKYSADSIKTK